MFEPLVIDSWRGITYMAYGKRIEENYRVQVDYYHDGFRLTFIDAPLITCGNGFEIGTPFAEELDIETDKTGEKAP